MRLRTGLFRLTVVALVAVAVVLVLAAPAFAAPPPGDIYVDAWVGNDVLGDGTAVSPYRTVGHAVDVSWPGCTIHVGGGIYVESVYLPSYVTLSGAGADTTFMVLGSEGAIVSMSEVADVEVSGITFSGSDVSCMAMDLSTGVRVTDCVFENSTSEGGAGIAVADSELEVDGCAFRNLESYEGAGLHSVGGTRLSVTDSEFSFCEASGDGGAVYVSLDSDAGSVYLGGCSFTDNSGEDGGAVDFDDLGTTASVEINGCYFAGNASQYDSGAIDLQAYAPDVIDCEFYENQCGIGDEGGSGGALWMGGVTDGLVQDCYFGNNSSPNEGGAISMAESGYIELDGNEFWGNSAYAEGGAVFAEYCEYLEFDDSYFEGNESSEDGGAMAVGDSDIEIDDTEFYQNNAYYGGAVSIWSAEMDIYYSEFHENEAVDDGGAISVFAWGDDDSIYIEDTYIEDNVAGENGGGIYWVAEGEYNRLSLDYCDFARNSAESGGGVYYDGATWGDEFHADDCDFDENVATSDGGAIYAEDVDDDLCLWDNHYEGNTAGWRGGALYATNSEGCGSSGEDYDENSAGYGGAIAADSTDLVIDEAYFWANTAFVPEFGEGGGDGGAIYASRGTWIICEASDFEDNVAEGVGGAICDYTLESVSQWCNNVFAENEAASGAAAALYGRSTFAFNTLWRNSIAPGEWGPAVYSVDPFSVGASIITNCIFEDNPCSYDVDGWGGQKPTYSYTYEEGEGNLYGWPGPMFADPEDGDFRITQPSACVDTGSFVYASVSWDHDWNYRPQDGNGDENSQPDMGAFELAAPEAPYAWDSWYWTEEDQPLDMMQALAGHVRDVNGDTLSFSMVAGPSNGMAVVLPDGSFIYAPQAEFSGQDSFTYQVFDGTYFSNTATVYIDVSAVADPPEAVADEFTIDEDTSEVLDVCANDSDPDSEGIWPEVDASPANGTASVVEGGIEYTPEADFTGTDTFTYRATDGEAYSEPVEVTVNVAPVNDAPVAVDDTAECDEDSYVDIDVLANDTDIDSVDLWVAGIDDVTNGSVDYNEDGTLRFTPDPDFNGTASFTYTNTDEGLESDPATVTIEVAPVNDAPVASTNYYSCDEDGRIVVNAPGVLGNDSDPDGDQLTARLDSEPGNGTLEFNADGSFVYTPDPNVSGHFHLYYSAFDGEEYSHSVYTCLNVGAVNDAPTVTDDETACDEDSLAELNVLANDDDVDNDELTAELKTEPLHGTVELYADGDVVYTPDADWSGTDTFTYRAYDGHVYSVIGVVTVVVDPVNDAPVAQADSYEVDENTLLAVEAPGVLGNDSDIDGDTIAAMLTSGPEGGELELHKDGSFTYMPEPGFFGEDTFEYAASDDGLESQPVVVTITVNDTTPPVTTSDAVELYSDVATITLTPADSGSGVAHTYYSLDGAEPVEGTLIEAYVLGDHTLSFWSVDSAGNAEEPVYVEFRIESAGTAFGEISGESRYETAVEVSKDCFKEADTVLVATGEMWPDALGSAALAGVSDAPILLTQKANLPDAVAAEIERLGATHAYVIGGTGAVSDAVELELADLGLDVTRLGGTNRYETARLVAEEVADVAGSGFGDTCFVATGIGFPDSLAAGPLSAKTGWPLMLAGPDGVDEDALVSLVDLGIDKVIILGGSSAVASDVEAELNMAFGDANVSRIAGADRYATAVEVARYGVANCGLAFDGMAVATGQAFPDALAAGPMQAKLGSVLVCTPSTYLHDSVRLLLIGQRAMINDVRFVGGTAAVSMPVRNAVADALR